MKLLWTTTILPLFLPNTSNAYVSSGLPGHKHRAWLKKMTYDICQLPPGELTPEMCTTTPQILSAWAQNPYINHSEQIQTFDIYPHHGKECALECERLLKRLVDERRAGNENAIANTETYNALIDVWSRSGEQAAAAQRAEQILIQMQDAFEAGHKEVQPNVESFRLVIHAWSKAGRGEQYAAHRAQRVLEWMINLQESGVNKSLKVNSECFDIVLHAWAISHHKDAPRKTEELLMLMNRLYESGNEDVKPTRLSFNQVLTAWSKSYDIGAAQRAEDVLDHMERLSEVEGTEYLRPNIVSYSTVASAWARGRTIESAKRAHIILDRVEREFKAEGDYSLRPDNIIFNVVIEAYAKSSANGKFYLEALSLLERQIALYESGVERCKPDVYSYTSVLSACASFSGLRTERLKVFEIASSIFDRMCKSDAAPNWVTYGTMLKACARLLPMGSKQRKMFTKLYFEKACQDGCVGEMVMSRFKQAASPELYRKLLKGSTKSVLPPEWTWQVPENEKRLRRNRPSLSP